MANFYALLIGIDYYHPKPDNFDHLQGCVRDIDKMAEYLKEALQIPPEQITRLTSPLPDTNSTADVRSARKEMPPTYQNIVEAFDSITKTAQSQDLVYIHYSGHGGRVKTVFPDLKKGEEQYDEGLVPMDVGNNGHYLRDVEMTTLLKRMTDQGLVVTVVFDSCHSGGTTRGDGAVRGSRNGFPDTKDRPADSAVADRETLAKNWLAVTTDRAKDSWLPNQRDYVFLGACRPTELANEFAFDGQDRNGALTYWMLDTLNAVPTGLTYQSLYDRIKGQIQGRFANQLPMLIGEGARLVFGSEIQPLKYSLTVVKVESSQVTLDGGLAQGISRGARFALYPVGSDYTDLQQRIAVVEVFKLKSTTSIANILTRESGGVAPAADKIELGLPAVMEAAPLSLRHPIRLLVKDIGNEEAQLPLELANKQVAALEKVRHSMQENGWLTEVAAGEAGHFQVAVGRSGAYEISCKGIPITNLTPALSVDDDASPDKVIQRLVHLGKYQSAQTLDNPASKLEEFLKFELLDQAGNPFPENGEIVLTQDSIVSISVENLSNQSLNIAVLGMDSTWEIYQLPIRGQENYTFYELVAHDKFEIKIDGFSFPDKREYKQAKECFKLFASRGSANFQWLILPTLDQQLPVRGERGSTRTRGGLNPLNDLLSSIGADMDDPPQVTRKANVTPDPNADWATKQIQIRVIKN